MPAGSVSFLTARDYDERAPSQKKESWLDFLKRVICRCRSKKKSPIRTPIRLSLSEPPPDAKSPSSKCQGGVASPTNVTLSKNTPHRTTPPKSPPTLSPLALTPKQTPQAPPYPTVAFESAGEPLLDESKSPQAGTREEKQINLDYQPQKICGWPRSDFILALKILGVSAVNLSSVIVVIKVLLSDFSFDVKLLSATIGHNIWGFSFNVLAKLTSSFTNSLTRLVKILLLNPPPAIILQTLIALALGGVNNPNGQLFLSTGAFFLGITASETSMRAITALYNNCRKKNTAQSLPARAPQQPLSRAIGQELRKQGLSIIAIGIAGGVLVILTKYAGEPRANSFLEKSLVTGSYHLSTALPFWRLGMAFRPFFNQFRNVFAILSNFSSLLISTGHDAFSIIRISGFGIILAGEASFRIANYQERIHTAEKNAHRLLKQIIDHPEIFQALCDQIPQQTTSDCLAPSNPYGCSRTAVKIFGALPLLIPIGAAISVSNVVPFSVAYVSLASYFAVSFLRKKRVNNATLETFLAIPSYLVNISFFPLLVIWSWYLKNVFQPGAVGAKADTWNISFDYFLFFLLTAIYYAIKTIPNTILKHLAVAMKLPPEIFIIIKQFSENFINEISGRLIPHLETLGKFGFKKFNQEAAAAFLHFNISAEDGALLKQLVALISQMRKSYEDKHEAKKEAEFQARLKKGVTWGDGDQKWRGLETEPQLQKELLEAKLLAPGEAMAKIPSYQQLQELREGVPLAESKQGLVHADNNEHKAQHTKPPQQRPLRRISSAPCFPPELSETQPSPAPQTSVEVRTEQPPRHDLLPQDGRLREFKEEPNFEKQFDRPLPSSRPRRNSAPNALITDAFSRTPDALNRYRHFKPEKAFGVSYTETPYNPSELNGNNGFYNNAMLPAEGRAFGLT